MNPFTEDYYMRGPEKGLSNYENYRWLPEITKPCAERMAAYLGMEIGDIVLDYGAARGFYVKALRELGFDAYGYDISEWAVNNCDPAVKNYMTSAHSERFSPDWIISKDTLEHVPLHKLADVVGWMLKNATKGILIIVPLADYTGRFYSPIDRADSTHQIAWPMGGWLDFIQGEIERSGRSLTVVGGYKLPGVKQATSPYPHATGFITIRPFIL